MVKRSARPFSSLVTMNGWPLIVLSILTSNIACSGFGASAADALGSGAKGGSGGQAGSEMAGGSSADDASAGGALTDGGGMAEAEASVPFIMTCDDIGQEPVIAPACATVLATKTTGADGKPSDETTLDTQAIQDAINACPAGQSVKLAADGDKNAFLSGPLSMKAGVTLWIDAGTTLFASRNPRVFDRTPGQCGLAGAGNAACSALFTVANSANVSIVGAGTV